jgi:hypothetical protein
LFDPGQTCSSHRGQNTPIDEYGYHFLGCVTRERTQRHNAVRDCIFGRNSNSGRSGASRSESGGIVLEKSDWDIIKEQKPKAYKFKEKGKKEVNVSGVLQFMISGADMNVEKLAETLGGQGIKEME